MWNLGHRDIIVLVSVISGCAILCNVWGPFVALTITLILVICGWFTFVVADDTPFTPHALHLLDYLEEASREVNSFVANHFVTIRGYAASFRETLKQLYQVHVVARMAQRRRSTYQLSSETTFPNSRNPRFNLEGLSPIARGTYRPNLNSSNLENSPYVEPNSIFFDRGSSLDKVTSTPMVPWKKEDSRNGDMFGGHHLVANKSPWNKSSSLSHQNHSLSRAEDTSYSPEGSPWGTSISPKMRARAGGVKTVQTVAGPLLASTRYNIDAKVFSDVTSPGLTTRLNKYATEANSKLTHQSQYAAGQFPRVNLNSSPTPLINTKTGKMRMPVTVRVAPPENTRYSPPERQKILSNICHAESKTPPSVVQVLREISLKRHASREDVTFELAKKQRTEGVFSDGLENLEEMTQKRARDDSSRSEEEISPQNKSLRPAKRSKMPSCYDILSSLSSSINVSSGVKRKAIDTSRSGTPDVGKHFKSLDSSHGDGAASTTLVRSISEPTKPSKRALNDLDSSHNSDVFSPHKKLLESVPQKSILKSPPSSSKLVNKAGGDVGEKYRQVEEQRETRITKSVTAPPAHVPVKLTDKLFMKAEPQNIDKLKTLIEEHGSIKPRFTTNDTDEIKKSDIVNMRQTSMKTRLKSMFDAISGKVPSKINPEVVIQAEEVKSPSSSLLTASLTSSTSTTNINTSPIATSAIVPIIGKTKPNTTPAKHVTFQFSTTSESSVNSSSAEAAKAPISEAKVTSSSASDLIKETKVESPAVATKPAAATNSLFQSFNSPSTTTAASSFSFGSPSLNTSLNAAANATPTSVAKSTCPSSLPSTAASIITTSPPQFNSTHIFNASTTSVVPFGTSTPAVVKSTASSSALPTFNAATAQPAEKNSQTPAVGFSFGTPATSAPASQSQNASLASTQSPLTFGQSQGSAIAAAPNSTPAPTTSSSLFGSVGTTTAAPPSFASTTSSSFAAAGGAPATTSMFSFGGNAAPQTTEKKAFTFGGSAASSAPSTTSAVGSLTTSQTAASSAAPASGGFNFSASNAAPMKNNGLFGSATTTSSATPSSGFATATNTSAAFTFGANDAAASKPGFSFGSSATTAATGTPASTGSAISFGTSNNSAAPIFGAPSTTAATTTASSLPSLFGTPATTAAATTASNQSQSSLFRAPATSAVGFGTSSSAAPPAFGTTSNPPSFAVASNSNRGFGAQKTMETPAFGSNMAAPPAFAATSTSSSLFSGGSSNANANPAATTAAPAFGTSGFGQSKPPPAFGANINTTFASGGASAGGSSLFGSQPTNPPAFGAAAPAAGSSTSMFGTPSTAAQTFGTPTTAPPPFGATNTSTTSFGAVSTAAPSFGAINTTTPAFGLQSSAAGTSGNSSSAFSAASPAFGAATTTAPPPAFGSTITSSSGFGTSATTGFGTSGNPPPAFGSGSSGFAGFGASNNTQATPFGSQPAAATSSFGTPNAAAPAFGSGNNNPSSSFTFGSSQPAAQPVQQQQQQQQQQQNAVFSFGGNNAAPANNAPGGSAPFQFGSSAPQAGGFNFSGAPSTPALNFSKDGAAGGSFAAPANAFNAPPSGGGMFSIGSGSTGPRTRPSRRRQR